MIRTGGARGTRASRVAGLIASGGVIVAVPSCDPIEPRPLVKAPMNTCPCDDYEPGPTAPARCSSRDRCEILTGGGHPEFPFWIVVHVPDSSIFAPGLTYVLYSDAQGNPAFKEQESSSGVITRCRPPSCLQLGELASASAAYIVFNEASKIVGYPLPDETSIPVRVVYEQLGNEQQETFPALPLDVLFASSRVGSKGAIESVRAVPFGRYRRIFYPQPPFDELFPPVTIDTPAIDANYSIDQITLGLGTALDDVGLRTAHITREAGLDGWRAWLVDRSSQRRISVIRTLSGTEVDVPLYTSGMQPAFDEDEVEAVVAPPESWTAVPRYVTPLFSGSGLNIAVPPIPPPVSVAGVVAEPGPADGGVLFGYAARVTFESESLATNADSSRLLHYSTTVNTDNRGRFATVLPPGTYAATVEPAEGTGYAKRRELVVVDRALTALTFQPPPRTLVKGRAVLTDGRALSEADVVATPNMSASVRTNPLVPPPRPGRTRTGDDGRFELELDPGSHVITVIPKAGTGFPRVVIRPDIPGSLTAQEALLPEIRVPAPTRMAFTLRDPGQTGNPIANAVVRIFAQPAVPAGATNTSPSDPLEIGSAMTGPDGSVEILLAQEPR